MPYLKFSNVNYYHGGGKTPYRLRHNQNYRMWVKDANYWLEDGEQWLIDRLWSLTKGRVAATSTTAVKVTEHSNSEWSAKVRRRKAMKWWYHLSIENKAKFTDFYYSGRVEISLTDREIESIYLKEVVYK